MSRSCRTTCRWSWTSRRAYPRLFVFHPDVAAIATAPALYQVHATAAWVIWGVGPFSCLVHAWSAPLWCPFIVYRSRRPARPAEPGTSGRRWRKIGVPY